MPKGPLMPFIKPDRYFSAVTAIDPQADLAAAGVRAVLLDMDNTLVARDTHDMPASVRAWLDALPAFGITACLFSNNWHETPFQWGKRLGLPVVAKACKPLPFAYGKALRVLNAQMNDAAPLRRSQVACIGDQLSTDVWGAHVAGMRAYLVEPLTSVDLKHTVIVRKAERALLAGMKPEA